MVFAPAVRFRVTVASAQVAQFVVTGNDWLAATVAPLAAIDMGRSAVVPLAKCTVSLYAPALATVTGRDSVEPVALFVLQNPVPENPAWLESIVPSQVPDSASNRFDGGGPPVGATDGAGDWV